MSLELFEWENLFASARTCESQILEDFEHDPILWMHHVNFVANRTFILSLIYISVATSSREVFQTVFASAL